jgi:hypothetical protein
MLGLLVGYVGVTSVQAEDQSNDETSDANAEIDG